MKRLAAALLLVLPLTVPLAGQPTAPHLVAVTGRVLPVAGPVICTAKVTHYLECTEVYLRAGTGIDLKKVEGQIVKVIGEYTAGTCQVIEVTAVANATATLDWCGMPSPSCPLRFVICPGGLSLYWLFGATGPGFFPLDMSTGSFLLDLHSTVLLLAGPSTGGSCTTIDVKVPWVPAIVGLDIHMQAARMDIGPVGPTVLTNPVCFTITPFMPPCAPIGC